MFLQRFKPLFNSTAFALRRYNSTLSEASHSQHKPIDITVRKDILSLTFQLTGERPINFFVSPSFTFTALKQAIGTQYPNSEIEFDFSHAKKTHVDEDANVIQFLNNDQKGEIQVHINEDTFLLKNLASESLSNIIKPIIDGASADVNRVTSWYQKCLEKGIPPSHAGPLSYMLYNVQNELIKQKGKGGKLAEKDLDAIFEKAVVFGREPIDKRLEECYHELNVVNIQIQDLEKEKISIEEKAEKRVNLYLKLILLVTALQFGSFYYMIFHVDWLGWDIIEPITYTVQCLTVLFGLRFFMKHGLGRDPAAIRALGRNRVINSNRITKARYQLASQQLANKLAQRDLLVLQRDLYLNRRNYYQFYHVHDINKPLSKQ